MWDRTEGLHARSSQTFLFADIAGFTALTEAHGDEEAADVVERFGAEVGDAIAHHDGEHVKTIGDALMIRVVDPACAVKLGLAIVLDLTGRHGSPTVRVGMHHGPAVERGGDWFGGAVNLAARISGAAAGGEVLVSAATVEAAGQMPGVYFEHRGPRKMRNVAEAIGLFCAWRHAERAGEALYLDPVCRMAVDPDRSSGRLDYSGTEYFFCSLTCASAFAAFPARYATTDQDTTPPVG